MTQTPYKLLTRKHPNASCLCIFGSKVYIRKPSNCKDKLDFNLTDGVFVGYTATLDNIVYIDAHSGYKGRAKHAKFDKSNFTQNSYLLALID